MAVLDFNVRLIKLHNLGLRYFVVRAQEPTLRAKPSPQAIMQKMKWRHQTRFDGSIRRRRNLCLKTSSAFSLLIVLSLGTLGVLRSKAVNKFGKFRSQNSINYESQSLSERKKVKKFGVENRKLFAHQRSRIWNKPMTKFNSKRIDSKVGPLGLCEVFIAVYGGL